MAGGGLAFSAPGAAANAPAFEGRVTAYVVLASVVAASGGLLFGYDIGVTGGVTTQLSFLQTFFPDVLAAQQAAQDQGAWCKFNSQLLQLFTSSLFLAGIAGAAIAWRTTSSLGRVVTMRVAGAFFLLGATLTASSRSTFALVLGRVCLGVGVGLANQAEYEDISRACNRAANVRAFSSILSRKYQSELMWAILLPMFQQLTGINAIMFYCTPLFSSLGFGSSASLYSAVVIGIINVFATLISILTVDRFGRKVLFLAGGILMILMQVAIATTLAVAFSSGASSVSSALAAALVACIGVYVSGFAFSWGPLAWLVPSEIQPLETRSAGQAITVATNFLFTFFVGQAFLSMLCFLRWGIFLLFAVCVVVMTVVEHLFLPETKGIPIEDVASLWDPVPTSEDVAALAAASTPSA